MSAPARGWGLCLAATLGCSPAREGDKAGERDTDDGAWADDSGGPAPCAGHTATMWRYQSTDQGESWTSGEATVHCASGQGPVDPELVALDGGDLLVYYLANDNAKGEDPLASQPDGTWRFAVARSVDGGLHFTEEAVLIEGPTPIADPALVRVSDGGWRMYYSEGADIVSAFAVDPLGPFVREAGARLSGQGGSPGVLQIGGITHLFTCPAGIARSESPDGLAFTPGETALSLPPGYDVLCDPSPTRTDAGFVMAVKLLPAGGAGPFDDVVALARSADGLTWALDPVDIGPGSVPGLVERADGAWLIYAIDP